MDDEFHAIIMDAIERARKIECSIEEFIEGLQGMAEELGYEAEAAEESLKRKN